MLQVIPFDTARTKGKSNNSEVKKMSHHDTYLSWLNDAYAMEKELEKVLQSHADDAKDYPHMQARIQEHQVLTRSHADRLKTVIERNGGDTSTVKTGIAKIMGALAGIPSEFTSDKLIKNTLADYASENFEIACYRSLIAAAESIGDVESIPVYKNIIREEEEMCSWLEEQLPTVTYEMMKKAA